MSTRADTSEIKALLTKRIGHHRAGKYFDQLTKLFTWKTSKSEFDKSCIRIIGRENVPLHNKLIRSIIKNACLGKVPPPLKAARKVLSSSLNVSNGCPGSSSLQSPRKGVPKDHLSLVGPFSNKPQNVLPSYDLISSAQEQSFSLGSRPPPIEEVGSVEEGEEVEQQSRSTVTAPLGIYGVSRKALLLNMSVCSSSSSSYVQETCQSSGELPDTRLLRKRLQHKLLQGESLNVSVECVNLLNRALDAYLKRLIEPCMRLAAGSRRSRNDHLFNQPSGGGGGGLIQGPSEVSYCRYRRRITDYSLHGSMLDFHVSMESNPQLLGPDYAVQLERICLRASEE